VRLLLRVLAPLLGLLLAAAGLAIVVETVTLWVAPASSPLVLPWPAWRTAAEGLTWQSGAVRGTAIVVGVVGLLVLLLGLVARRHDVFLADPVPEVTVTTSPHSLARAVGHEVRSHADVVSASVVASAKKITVKASTLDPAETVRDAVRERVDELLGRLPLARRPKVSVSVTTTKGVK
jgi:hypothetical protein